MIGILGIGNPLRPLEDFLQSVLIWLHETGGFSWAWSIVVLTVIVRVLLVPITVKQIHSMQSLQAHAPEMKALQQKWKHDKQRQNEELMKFYRENKINPAASCLPIVLQIPIFISLFYVLREFEADVLPTVGGSVEWLGLIDITENIGAWPSWGPLLLVIYVASRRRARLSADRARGTRRSRTASSSGGTCTFRPASAGRTCGARPERALCRCASCSRLSEHLGHLLHEPDMSAGIRGVGETRAGREHVVTARRHIGCEFLPRLAQLALEAIADDRVADGLRDRETETGFAGGIVLTWKPMQRQIARRDRPALPVDRIEVLRP